MRLGRGISGQLGHGKMVNALISKIVDSLIRLVVVNVAAGWSHSGFVTGLCQFTMKG